MCWFWILLVGQVGVPASGQAVQRGPSPAQAMQAAMEKQRAAAAIQREAGRKHAEAVRAWFPATPLHHAPEFAGDADCEPISELTLAPILAKAATAQKLKPQLLRAVIEQESGFRPCAVSGSGAQGLMQLMPATAEELGVSDPFDPAENVAAGARYLKELLDKYGGDLFRGLSAYNAGPSAVDEAGGVPAFPETRDYVGAILRRVAGQ